MENLSQFFEEHKKLVENRRELLRDNHEVIEAYQKESDRSAAILASSFLEEVLGETIRSFLVEDKSVDDLFKGYSPLSTLSSKIDFAYALGLITKEMKQDLDIVRKIRNHFAHNWKDASFNTSPVSDFCRNLRIANRTFYNRLPDGKLVLNPIAKRLDQGIILGSDVAVFSFKEQYLSAVSILISSILHIFQFQIQERRVVPLFDYLGTQFDE